MSKMLTVAKYIVNQSGGEISAMKLQKLMYYAQAWNLVWEEHPLFDEDFEAWANGPVLAGLYDHHRGKFSVTVDTFPPNGLSELAPEEKETIDNVLGYYGKKTAQYLSALTHQEDPWKDVRERCGCEPGDRCGAKITKAAMHEYYSSL